MSLSQQILIMISKLIKTECEVFINMKRLFLLLTLSCSLFVYSQNDTIIKRDIYTVNYSQKLKQPLWLEYGFRNRTCNTTRTGLDFYTEKGVITSTNEDYANNDYDKGHMAPAADFCKDKQSMYLTFSYLNCALQHYKLNRGVWKELESMEREWAKTDSLVIKIEVIFDPKPKKTNGGASIPKSFRKTILFYNSKKKLVYEFPNVPPTKSLEGYLIKQ
jgi:endonuclease G